MNELRVKFVDFFLKLAGKTYNTCMFKPAWR